MSVPAIRPQGGRSLEKIKEVMDGLSRPDRTEQLHALLGSDKAVERFKTVVLHYLSGNSDVMERCTPASILEAIREAATLDLEPTGILGEAWIVRQGERAVLRVGWRGFLKLLRNSDELAAVDCQIVYEHDDFHVELGTNAHIRHIPTLETDRGEYRGAYAWARMKSGELIIEWMTTADIEEVRKVSSAKEGPWKTWWSEMARKSPIRRISKRLPMSPRAQFAVAIDEAADKLENQPITPARAKTLLALAEATGLSDEEKEKIAAAVETAEDSAELDAALEDSGGSTQQA